MKRLLAALLLVGCDGGASYECTVPHMGAVYSVDPIDCGLVRLNFDFAHHMLTERWTLIDEGTWNAAFSNTYFRINHERGHFDVWGSVHVGGYQDSTNGNIYICRDMRALAHEMLHQFDDFQGRGALTGTHPGWKANGYDDAANTFANDNPEPPDYGSVETNVSGQGYFGHPSTQEPNEL